MRRTIEFLASFKFALGLLLVTALACAVGTVLEAVGMARIYASWWFVALLCVLAASLLACTFRRFSSSVRTAGRMTGRAVGSVLTHVSILFILTGGVVRVVWSQRGTLALREGQRAASFRSPKGEIALPFDVQLVDFTIERYAEQQDRQPADEGLLVIWPERQLQAKLPVVPGTEQLLAPPNEEIGPDNSFRVSIIRRVPDFVLDTGTRTVTTRSQEPRNPAILVQVVGAGVTNRQWLFAYHPDFNMGSTNAALSRLRMYYRIETAVKSYASTIRILDGGDVLTEGTIEVNSPLSHEGYKFYQLSYNPYDLAWTSLQVVNDPSVPLVFTGFALMLTGLTMVLYLCRGNGHGRSGEGAAS